MGWKDINVHPACAILGPRQVGKTTLARMFLEQTSPKNFHFFDLENPLDLARLENPILTLSKLPDKLIVIDEIQRAPELFPVIRVLIDDKQKRQKFLILGGASRDLIRQSSFIFEIVDNYGQGTCRREKQMIYATMILIIAFWILYYFL